MADAIRTGRAYAGAHDLRRLQDAVAAAIGSTILRVGDLAWFTRLGTHRQLGLTIRLWEDETGRITGAVFLSAKGLLVIFVTPGETDAAFIDEMLASVDEVARAAVAAGDPAPDIEAYGIDLDRSPEDRAIAAALERNGFAVTPSESGLHRRSLDDLPEPRVPAGYRLAAVETREQVIGRVEAHRAAFAPSELTLGAYTRVRRTWPYRPDLDRIVVTDDGVVAAFCTVWFDETNGTGLLEPVGTHPDHQRRGLASAVCLDGLHALRAAGARTAEVGFIAPAASALYRSIGFEPNISDLVYRRPPSHSE